MAETNITYGVQTVLSTIPYQNDHGLEDDIEKNYFKKYKDNSSNEDTIFYKPLKFYLLGDYDVVYISLINNFKFSHRLFEPIAKNNKSVFKPHTFQSYSGFSLNKESKLQELFSTEPNEYFIGIINLKINNGLLLGNGLQLLDAIKEHIDEDFNNKKINYLITQTLSWFELSITVFTNQLDKLSYALTYLRTLEFDCLKNSKVLNKSLYRKILEKDAVKNKLSKKALKENIEKINRTSLFSDTHTYFGFNKELINKKLKETYVKDFEEYVKKENISVNTQIEWQVKPGHIAMLQKTLQKHTHLKEYFDLEYKQLKLGKSDFLLQKTENVSILATFHLVRDINRDDAYGIFKHARKVRSYISLQANDKALKLPVEDHEPLEFEEYLCRLAIKNEVFYDIDKKLKALKVSRQLRIKILKIFSNYNNGIQDPILFPYFIDFKIFIDNIVSLVEEDTKGIKQGCLRLSDLESKLYKHVEVFQEGYNVRFLNSYQFENISEFDLDFNSSIQQLLASYGFLLHEYGSLFYAENNYYPIIQLNDTDTVSNHLSINYSVHHLTSPEFVFTTILKEILNNIRTDLSEYSVLSKLFQNNIEEIKNKINESYFDDLILNGHVDLNNFIVDALRFLITFNCDYDLFFHWLWTYNFQNSSLFNASGMFNEDYLRSEMLRVFLIKDFFNIECEDKECPIPELSTFWHRHEDKIKLISKRLSHIFSNYEFKVAQKDGSMKVLKFELIIESVMNTFFEKYKNYPNSVGNKNLSNYKIDYQLFQKLKKISGPVISKFIEDKDLYFKRLLFLSSKKIDAIYPIHEIEKLIFKTLYLHYKECDNKIMLLKRDWFDGEILDAYAFLYSNKKYVIDQTGGPFFFDSKKATEYFSENCQSILEIIDFTLKQKANFFLNKMEVNNE